MSEDLFETGAEHAVGPAQDLPLADAPLAERMRPRTLGEVVGQQHLVGSGRILERWAAGKLVQSLILWGPPGCGKTTLARLLARSSGLRFVPFSAVLSGIKEIKEVMAEAERERARGGRRSLLFVDEIHRFNKAQQDAFLPYVERGVIVLIGATTENPSFEIVSALLSRARVLVLQALTNTEVVCMLERALTDPQRGYAARVQATPGQLERIAAASDGDVRRALTLLETAVSLLPVPEQGQLDDALLADALQRKSLRYDKSGEQHYDLISALHKSVRNSDTDASIYWLTRMLEAGEDRDYLARRLLRMALEDIGIAAPSVLHHVLACAETWQRLGSPEGELALVQAAVLLARAPKSNAVYLAYSAAREDVETTAAEQVPLHLRNAPTGLMKSLGYGQGYRYAHDDPAAAQEMSCLPPSLLGRRYLPPNPGSVAASKPETQG